MTAVCWGVMPAVLVYQHFRRTFWLHIQVRRSKMAAVGYSETFILIYVTIRRYIQDETHQQAKEPSLNFFLNRKLRKLCTEKKNSNLLGFWVVISCSHVGRYRHLNPQLSYLNSKDGGSVFIRNIDIRLKVQTVSQPRTP
jgi:hypothetical protein